jgi:uncharacterized membrane protein
LSFGESIAKQGPVDGEENFCIDDEEFQEFGIPETLAAKGV